MELIESIRSAPDLECMNWNPPGPEIYRRPAAQHY